MADPVLEALEKLEGNTLDALNTQKEAQSEASLKIVEKLGTLQNMARANETSIAELREKDGEYAAKITSFETSIAEQIQAQKDAKEAIDTLNGTITDLRSSGNLTGVLEGTEKADEALTKSALSFYQMRHNHTHAAQKGAPKFDVNTVDADKVKEYALVRSAIAKMYRSDAAKGQSFGHTPAEAKAISTVTNGDQFFMPTEVSSVFLRCFTDETNLIGMFDNIAMGGHELVMPVIPQEGVYSTWSCEGSCDNEDTELQQWGSVTLAPKELRAKACLTRTMANDSVVDIEGRLGGIARRSFEQTITRDYVSSGAKGGIQGAFDDGNHVSMPTGTALEINPIDLVKLAKSFPAQFRAGARWFMDCNTEAFVCTMQKPNGDFYFDLDSDTLLRYPVETVDQMPGIPAAGPMGGSKPIALVNPREHYILGRREEFQASRNPYSKEHCGLILWYFYMRIAGQVKCPNAFRALTVKEA